MEEEQEEKECIHPHYTQSKDTCKLMSIYRTATTKKYDSSSPNERRPSYQRQNFRKPYTPTDDIHLELL